MLEGCHLSIYDPKVNNDQILSVLGEINSFTPGIKISSEKPLYVVNINANENKVIVGSKENLEIKEIKLRDLNILARKEEFKKIIKIIRLSY